MPSSSVKRIVAESYPVLLTSALMGFFAGYVLDLHMEKIRALPLILMAIPPLNGLGGNIGSILGARLASALHLGSLKPEFSKQPALLGNFKASLLSGGGAFGLLWASFLAIALVGEMAWGQVTKLALALALAGGGVIVAAVMLTTFSAFLSYRKGIDPDNVVIPIITSTIDVLSVACLLIAVQTIGV